MFSGFIFGSLTFIWLLMPIFTVVGLLFTVFNVWMTIDAIKRFNNDNRRVILYLLLVWLVPFGGLIYYLAAISTSERFVSTTISRHRSKFIVMAGVVLLLLALATFGIVYATTKTKQAWDTKQAEVEREMQRAKEEQKRIEAERKKFSEDFKAMKDQVETFNQGVASEVEKSKVMQVCVANFYSGIACNGEPPTTVKKAAAKIGVTDNEEIKEICGCASQDNIDRFKQGF